jgi:hypothetical protein
MGKIKDLWNEFKQNVPEVIDKFAEEHPIAYVSVCGLAGFAASVPLAYVTYKWYAGLQGRETAKALMEAGVQLGYNHE